jgi:elongation factor Ts
MAEITAKMVMELRERTGVPMMKCKAALTETNGDFEAAVKKLREQGAASGAERAARTASEGVVAVLVVDNQDAAIVELNSETDFVARNDEFKALATELAQQVIQSKGHSVETVLTEASFANPGQTVQDRVTDVYNKLRENIVFRRFELISTDANGSLAAYTHKPANDKIGVLVEIEAESPEAAQSEAVQAFGKELAMQIAASRPKYLTDSEVPEAVVEQEREIALTKAKNENKPEAALPKIAEGAVRKYYEGFVLMNQPWLREPKKTVAQAVKDAGNGISIKRFVRYEVGENVTGADTSGAIKETAE